TCAHAGKATDSKPTSPSKLRPPSTSPKHTPPHTKSNTSSSTPSRTSTRQQSTSSLSASNTSRATHTATRTTNSRYREQAQLFDYTPRMTIPRASYTPDVETAC